MSVAEVDFRSIIVLAIEPLHAANPTVVVARFTPHILKHLRVRQNKEFFGLDAANTGLGHIFRFQHTIDSGDSVFRACCHGGTHRLRAKN